MSEFRIGAYVRVSREALDDVRAMREAMAHPVDLTAEEEDGDGDSGVLAALVTLTAAAREAERYWTSPRLRAALGLAYSTIADADGGLSAAMRHVEADGP